MNKFKPNISPQCTFCSHLDEFSHPELVSHLFFDCDFALKLWQELKHWLVTLNLNLPLNRAKLLFGIHEEASNSKLNFIILCTKYFIWKTKFGSKNLTLSLLQKFIYLKLTEHKDALFYGGKIVQFQDWNDIYDCLSRIPECTAQDVALSPTQALVPDTPAVDPARTA